MKINLRKTLLLFLMLKLPVSVSAQDKHQFPILKGEYLGQKPPGRLPEIFAPGIINTNAVEMCISFIPGAKELYFSRRIGHNR